jgi:pyruvate kinase
MLAGLDVARINMSHGVQEHHGEVIKRIRAVAGDLKRPLAVMLDLGGPKIRTGKLRGGQAVLEDGAVIRITSEEIEGDARRFSAGYPLLAAEVRAGDRILLSDGELELEAVCAEENDLIARVVHGGILGEHKGVNLPGAQVSIPSITEKDILDLRFGIENGVDIVAQSFVRSAADCKRARDLIDQFGGKVRLIAKIEKPEAVGDLSNIIDVADGVMVARGDLAVETLPERVPILQKEIISAALNSQKTVITATQMLQSMIESPQPTRAEASDVANAVLDGSDALMLSGETAIGRYPVEAVEMMVRIIRTTEASLRTGPAAEESHVRAALLRGMIGRQSGSIGRAIAEAAVFAAEELGCRLIVVFTQSGHMARRVAALRPRQRIIALTPLESSYKQLPITWGVEPFPLEDFSAVSDEMLQSGDRALLKYGLAEPGEAVVVMAGRMPDLAISTSMKLHHVGDLAGLRR